MAIVETRQTISALQKRILEVLQFDNVNDFNSISVELKNHKIGFSEKTLFNNLDRLQEYDLILKIFDNNRVYYVLTSKGEELAQ